MKDCLWELLQRIPKGKVTTYSELAKVLGTSPRVIGSLLRSNKDLDSIPCYKVVMSNGQLGGYSLGVTEKVKRLHKDGVYVNKGKIASFDTVLFSYQ
ncbi:MGMT family protein [archaeon]|nr:MGMT family protein [archaeon]